VLERTGDFSASSKKPRDPLTNQPFPGALIPSSRFDGVAVKILDKYLPLPNTPDGRWVSLVSQPTNNDQYLWRVDHNFSGANTLNLRFFRDDSDVLTQAGNTSPYSPNTSRLLVDNWALHDTHTFSPSLLNEFHLGVNRVDTRVSSPDPTQLSDFGGILPGVTPPQLPRITVNGYFNMDSGLNYLEHGNIYQLSDSMSWFRGRHAAKFGGEFQLTQMINRASTATNDYFTFDGSTTTNAFADYIIGKPITSDQSSPYDRGVNGHNFFVFAQDDWRVSRTLTVNVGLRYEYAIPFYQGHDWTNTYRPGQQSTVTPTAPLGMVFPGDAGVTRGITTPDKNNFAPRLGFAWDPRGDGKLAIRAYYGLFYEDFGATNSTYAAVNQPFVIRELINNPFSLTDPYHGRVNPFPYIFTPGIAKFSYPMGLFTVQGPNFSTPYIHQLSFSVERSLPGGMVVKGAYVGKLEHNLTHMVQKNPAVYIPGKSTTANTDDRRILMPGIYSSFREIDTDSNATYHSMQLTLSRHLSHGFTFLTAYTFGKLLDLFSGQTLGNTPQDPYNERADRSRSDEDRTHVFATSFVYEIPLWRNGKGVLPKAFGGWALSGVVSAASGLPVAVVSNRDNSLTGVGFDRPDLVGDPVRSHSSRDDMIQQFFNVAAFVANQPGKYGTAGRNLFSGPGQSGTDLSLVKNFVIAERLGRIQFRAEAFNAWNQVSFSQPEARLDNRLFGKIQSAASPRIFQFALKYLF
jgi:predicted heme/steroid binding protein